MESDQTEKTLTPDDLLVETVEALLAKGEPVGNFKSHFALMLACTKIVWGPVQKYQKGTITLNPERFCKESLESRMRTLSGLLTDVISDLYISLRDKDQNKR